MAMTSAQMSRRRVMVIGSLTFGAILTVVALRPRPPAPAATTDSSADDAGRARRLGSAMARGPRFVAPEPGSTAEQADRAEALPDTRPWRQIKTHLRSVGRIGPGARDEYDWTLARLKKNGRDMALEIAAHYQKVPAELQDLRFSLLFLLGELDQSEGEELLARAAASDGPAAKAAPDQAGAHDHHHDQMDPELKIRMAAVHGLINRLRAGSEPAKTAMLALTQHRDRETRLAALRALSDVHGGDTALMASLARTTRPDERFTIDGTQPAVAHYDQAP